MKSRHPRKAVAPGKPMITRAATLEDRLVLIGLAITQLGWSKCRVARALGVDPATVFRSLQGPDGQAVLATLRRAREADR